MTPVHITLCRHHGTRPTELADIILALEPQTRRYVSHATEGQAHCGHCRTNVNGPLWEIEAHQ